MAASREQTVRVVRPDAGVESKDASPEQSRTPANEESIARSNPDARAPGTLTPEAPAEAASQPAADAPKSGKRKFVLMGVGALLALAAVGYGINYMLVGRFMVSTDDAYVRANNTTLGARVSGHLARIAVGDNVKVKTGDLIFKIDDGDYVIAVDAARNKIATQQATIDRIGRQIGAQNSAAEQAQAQLASAEAAVKRAQSDFDRQDALSTRGFASRATFETSQAARDQAVASVQAAKAAFDAARDNVEVIKAQQQEARGQLDELKTTLAKAERDLAFTTIRAPVDGVFSNRLVNAGDYIQPGQRLGNVVPLDDVFIDANFKETQLARLKPGQQVRISVDAHSDQQIEGVVDSLSPASGSVFTLLPPDNATGNFTKIVQRVPVRIRVPAAVGKENLLRAGMSVYVSVNTKPPAETAVTTGAAR
ncbi:MAG: hemolysin D [Rhizobiales bacterium 62-47]|nr:HlyD family secretion protein [Hyphomicrobiales bacterium]OJY12050.1 MAG: hemolysin D [Rhizobiales bacterium 62-47]